MALKESLTNLSSRLEGVLYFDNTNSEHRAVLMAYATDASVYQEQPLAVALPKNIQDLKELIAFSSVYNITLIPRAAGTSLAGQVVGQGLVVDISRHFTEILELNIAEKWVRVQPGVIRDDLNAYLKPFGLMFGPETSTASRAMIGGMIGNNSSGLHSIVWGDTRSNLLETKMLLDDTSEVIFKAIDAESVQEKLLLNTKEGEIYRKMHALLGDKQNRLAIAQGFPKKAISRRNTGYALDLLNDQSEPFNFCKLIAGSEGTLGLITEAKLQVIPLPQPAVGIVCIHCLSIVESLSANIIALHHRPEASELVDKYILDFTKGHPTYQYNRFFIEADPAALLMVEFRGKTLTEVTKKAQALIDELKTASLGYAYPLITGPDTEKVWDVRKAGLGLIRNLPGNSQAVNLIEDCAVSPEDLPTYVQDIQQILAAHGVSASYYAHAGAGELHIEPILNLKTQDGRRQFRSILAQTADLVNKYNGSLSGEHGDGRLRGEFISTVLGENVYTLLKKTKKIFDESGVFNRGKIVDTPPMDECLRYAQETDASRIPTYFDFSAQENILRLAEKCSGSGDCRKTHLSGDTMCPSYMATREEKDTTRARANLLRQFLTRAGMEDNPYNHSEIPEIMDLCLSCKACKTECPSGVDITKMKAEFLQHYYDANGLPFRSWIIGNFTLSQRLASYVPGLYNFIIQNKALSSPIKRILGFASGRSLPNVGKMTLRQWMKKQQQGKQTLAEPSTFLGKKRVYFFCDEFTAYNDVSIGQTAFRLLTALGYEVIPAQHVESGRTYLSKGLLRKAKSIANRNVRQLAHLITTENPLIGIEPSAIITFRDEYPELVDNELLADAKKLAKNTLLIDEFLAAEMTAGHINKERFGNPAQRIKLHGHCYQKAFHLMAATEKILSFPEGNEVETIPSGCCGMAGSFGYEREHYEVSMKIGELVLFPAVRETPKDVWIAAPGTSCRHQIKDGTTRRAYHPVEILWEALVK